MVLHYLELTLFVTVKTVVFNLILKNPVFPKRNICYFIIQLSRDAYGHINISHTCHSASKLSSGDLYCI